MKRSTIRTLSTIVTMLLLSSFANAADTPTSEQEALMQSERDWAAAWANGDAEAVAELLADEYVLTNFDGAVSDKAADLADIKSGRVMVTWVLDSMNPMLFGDTGVVVGQLTQKGVAGGRDISGTFRFTDAWVKRDGRWQCVASQLTRIEKP